jgi:small subunit ribosomal protein S28
VTIKNSLDSMLMALCRIRAFNRLLNTHVRRSLSSEDSDHNQTGDPCEEQEPTFAEMFRKSKFAQLGTSLDNRVLEGKVVKIIDKDMFVDFGSKFYAVVKRPTFKHQTVQCHEGMLVRLTLKDLEITEHFLGHSKHTTFLEANAGLRAIHEQTDSSRD